MYKKIALLCVLTLTFTRYASDVAPWIEIKPSYFFFGASPMKNVYSKGGFSIQGSGSVPVHQYLALYASIGCRQAWGRALNTCEKTSLTVMPIDLGLKPIFDFCEHFYWFFAFGPRYFHFHQHNKSPYVDCKIIGNGIGLFANTGFNLLMKDCLLIGAFGEYSYEKKKICPKKQHVLSNGNVQLGGFAFGMSLGYVF